MSAALKNMVLVRFVIPFIFGILYSEYYNITTLKSIGLTVSVASIFILALPYQLPFSKRYIHGLITAILLFLAGALLHERNGVNSPEYDYYPSTNFSIETSQSPIEKANSIQLQGKFLTHDSINLIGQNLLVYLQKPIVQNMEKGEILVCNGAITAINGPMNPGEFNYQKFMARQDIYYRVFLDSLSFTQISEGAATGILENIKNRGRRFIKDHVRENKQSIANALILGLKRELDVDTKATFSRAGTMHILAVSGLHVGIIFLLANGLLVFLFRFLQPLKKLKPFLLIIIIWGFALLTGASPSVLRAALMFSLFAVGLAYFPYVNRLNILAAAAFLLLAYDTQLLFTVSFQLSFAAVAGILIIMPYLRKKFAGGNRVWRYFKDILFMSIAAQVATLPISIYYFKQFPALGLLANLYAIPLAFVVVASGFLGMLFSGFPLIAAILGKILDFSILSIDSLNTAISNQPFAVIEDIGFGISMVLALYLLIVAFLFFIPKPNGKSLKWVLITLAVLLGVVSWQNIKTTKRNEVIVHSSRNQTILQLLKGNKAYLISDTIIDSSFYSYSIKPYHVKKGVRDVERIYWTRIDSTQQYPFQLKNDLLQFNKLLIQVSSSPSFSASSDADIVICENPFNKTLEEHQSISNKLIVTGRWPSRKIPLHDALHFVKRDGAFITKTIQ